MKRWDCNINDHTESVRVDAFLKDVIEVCKKHNLWLSHEDQHGAFMVDNDSTEGWLMDANIERGVEP